jgi:ferredoxin-type protein NapG
MTTGTGIDRRQFFTTAARAAGGACLFGLGLGALTRHGAEAGTVALRPPGALAEADFLAACVRCGLCVQDCPYHTLTLAEAGAGVPVGTPSYTARKVPCEMCDTIPCVKACPTGALAPGLTDITKAKMGIAVLVDHESCLNWQGLRCDVCYRVCPLIDKAITLEELHNQRTGMHARFLPTVHHDLCTGCGKCEASCVLEIAAIKVLPTTLARGQMGAHYRLGWEEKTKNGEQSLIGETLQMPVRRPEGTKGFVP